MRTTRSAFSACFGGKALKRAAVAGLALLALGATPRPGTAETLVFMSGPAGGTWFPLAGAIKQLLEQRIDGLSVTVRPGAGLINAKGISLGKADLAWGNVISTVDAIAGNAPFNKVMPDICNIGAFYTQYVQIPVTDLSIETIADLRGKALATLPRGNTTEYSARALLEIYGMTYDDLGKINFASITDQVNMMKDGQVDAFVLVSSLPAGGVLDVATSRETRLLGVTPDDVARLKAMNPGWQETVIPAGTYSGQTEDVPTVSYAMHLMANCSSVSEELAYEITRALAEDGHELSAVTSSMAGFDGAALALDVGLPNHPGAERYFREVGLR